LKRHERISYQTTSTASAWRTELERILSSTSPSKRLALVGMGHPLRSDDFVGSYIAKKLLARQQNGGLRDGVYIFDGEDNVEVLISKIADLEPEDVIFIDASEMKAEAGETRLVSVSETVYPFFTTHGIPLKLLAEQLFPRSRVWILAIQPKDTDFGEHISPEMRSVANSISELFATTLERGGRQIGS
jgi:hydrogenase 3 maturation protease